MDLFVVDFQVGDPEEEFTFWMGSNETKDLLDGQRDDTRLIDRAGEGMSFTGGGLTVGKDRGIVTVHGG